ncbi:putative ADP-sugar diphosphatase [Helianthus annuus]|nr:putative ADP-sugar diphosphatase [Helianthus annuus]
MAFLNLKQMSLIRKRDKSIVFARGPAVAVLILLESEGKTYTVLTEQVLLCMNFVLVNKLCFYQADGVFRGVCLQLARKKKHEKCSL